MTRSYSPIWPAITIRPLRPEGSGHPKPSSSEFGLPRRATTACQRRFLTSPERLKKIPSRLCARYGADVTVMAGRRELQIGVARYVRRGRWQNLRVRPFRGRPWQHRGIGRALMLNLIDAAARPIEVMWAKY